MKYKLSVSHDFGYYPKPGQLTILEIEDNSADFIWRLTHDVLKFPAPLKIEIEKLDESQDNQEVRK